MAREALRIVRGTNGQVVAYLGPTGELVYNTDTKRVHTQDGATAGGVPLATLADIPAGSLAAKNSVAATDIDANAVTDAKLRDSAALTVIGRSANSTGDPADIAAGTDGYVLRRSGTTLGFGTIATAGITDNAVTSAKIPDNAITNAKLADVATATIKGRATAGTGDPEDLTVAQARTLLAVPALTDFAGTLSQNGQQLIANGLIIKWGYNAGGADNFQTFPVAFPTACRFVITQPTTATLAATTLVANSVESVSATGFTYRLRQALNGGSVGQSALPFFWVAFGS